MSVGNQADYVTTDETRGRIEDVRFENIRVNARGMPASRLEGHNTDHPVRRITIRNLHLNGCPATDEESANIQMIAFVEDMDIK
jgi:hypothetical protein